ncbi:MAG TPA: hypothetical protein VMJ70_03140 [Candidatus Sulfotelmatobacter sp.]|nr:hypothetical protein [Candidatus Sulfotelmatobacter sp.]
MTGRWMPLLAAMVLVAGCAGTAKLTQKSEEKLAGGDAWKAWQLAVRALDKEPGNPQARDAATAAGNAIAQEWQRKILALADVDSLQAADQVLEFVDFRGNAAHYATIAVSPDWTNTEKTLRRSAARSHYDAGRVALDSQRPKRAYMELEEALRFVTPYRDAGPLADRALTSSTTRVAVLPFRSGPDDPQLGTQVASNWRDALAQQMAPPKVMFTRVLSGDAVERQMTVSQLDGLARGEAVRIGRKIGADRVVWGSIGDVRSAQRVQFFRDVISRRIVDKDQDGHQTEHWVEVPIEVVARVRDVTVSGEYELISTKDGASIAHQQFDRATSARVVWTSYQPEGDLGDYVLVTDSDRSAHPDHAKDVESRWKAVCGDGVTLAQVLQARRATREGGAYNHDALARFATGAAFVFLQDLPPAEDLALAALTKNCSPLRDDLLRLDPIDEVDLGLSASDAGAR